MLAPISMGNPSVWRLRVAYAIWLFGVFAYFVPAATWNPVSRFSLTRALVEQRTFSIDAYAESTGDRAQRNGHWYSDKAPVPAFLAVPAYAVVHLVQSARGRAAEFHSVGTPDLPARRVTVNSAFSQGLYVSSAFTAGASGAILGVLVFEALRRRVSSRAALWASMATVLGTPIFPYATSFYGHVVAAAFLFAATTLLHDDVDEHSPQRVRWAGACLVLAAGSEYIVAGPGAVVAMVALVRGGRARGRQIFRDLAIGSAIPIAVLGAYHAACFGAPWRTGYSFMVREEFARGHASGLLGVRLPSMRALWGILFSPERGLFLVAPVLAVGTVAGVVAITRRRPIDPLALAAALATGALLLLNAGYYMWWGGASAGPRHIVPILPLLGLGVAAALVRRMPAPLTVFTLVLGVVSVMNMLVLSSVGLEAPESGNILVDYAWSRIASGKIAHLRGASNLAVMLGMAPAASMGPLLAWLLVGGRFVVREIDDAEEGTENASAVGGR